MESSKWYKEAKRLEEKGIHEIPGVRDNPDIMYMAKKLGITWYKNDEVPWCGLFVGYCVSLAGVTNLPKNILGAKQWRTFGDAVDVGQISEGDILVFWRGTPKGPNGHVGFYAGETKDAYKVLGGNQKNSVSYTWIAKSRLLAARRPSGYKAGPKIEISNSANHSLSTNEG